MADLFTHNELAALFNLSMQDYIDNPLGTEPEFLVIKEYENDVKHGRVPNYGKGMVAYLESFRDKE
jgi:hypothetical protein